MRRLVVVVSSILIVCVLLRTATLRRVTPVSPAPPFDPDAVLEEMRGPDLLAWARRSQQLLRDSRADRLRAANPTSDVAAAKIVPTAAAADAPGAGDALGRGAVGSSPVGDTPAHVVSRVSLADACEELAPAVAVRPAPSGSLASQLAVEAGPWQWAGSQASLTFDPDGLAGLLVTPWGEGRWGEAQPGMLWADWSGRTHLLRIRGAALTSYRCADGERLEATATAARAAAATPIRRACAAPSAAAGAGDADVSAAACPLLTRERGWRWDASHAALPPPGSSRRLTLLRTGDRAAEACEGAEDGDAANASGAAAAGGVSAGCRLAGLGRSCDCSTRWACVARGVAETRVAGAEVRLLARGREVVGVSCDGAAGPRIAFFAVGVVTADEADEEAEEEQEEGRPSWTVI